MESVQVLTSDKTRFSSPRVERSGGDITVLEKSAYTACVPCRDHPERPPSGRVKGARSSKTETTHTNYYEDAQLQFWGFPVFYMPYFSSADSTVNKKTGVSRRRSFPAPTWATASAYPISSIWRPTTT